MLKKEQVRAATLFSLLFNSRPGTLRFPVFETVYAQPVSPIRRTFPKVGRNDTCPCGSEKKYKRCHGTPGAPLHNHDPNEWRKSFAQEVMNGSSKTSELPAPV